MSSPSKKPTAQSYVELGRSILELEAQAIQSVALGLDESFSAAVTTVAALDGAGRVIVSGMGKAGFVAMKISATLASIGTSSYFLHPAEALHGDLGRYSKHDIALILSNSGETAEIVQMLGPIKRIGCPIISVTAQRTSTLAKHSDIVLPIGALNEVGPLGLAPTTSTTAMLALGDALTMAVLERKGLTKEEFAFFHPGGNLGRRLMLVSELMRSGNEHPVVVESMKTHEVLHVITSAKGRPGAASIISSNGILVGIFTDGNLRRCLERGSAFLEQPIHEVMTTTPKTIGESQLAEEALRIMTEHRIDQLIVVDTNNKPIGLIDIQDLVGQR